MIGTIRSSVTGTFIRRPSSCATGKAPSATVDPSSGITDTESKTTPLVPTAGYSYFRLRDEGYEEADLARWAQTASGLAARLEDVFVYFKHEEAGKGPEFARLFLKQPMRLCLHLRLRATRPPCHAESPKHLHNVSTLIRANAVPSSGLGHMQGCKMKP